jgi:hypothetical protein
MDGKRIVSRGQLFIYTMLTSAPIRARSTISVPQFPGEIAIKRLKMQKSHLLQKLNRENHGPAGGNASSLNSVCPFGGGGCRFVRLQSQPPHASRRSGRNVPVRSPPGTYRQTGPPGGIAEAVPEPSAELSKKVKCEPPAGNPTADVPGPNDGYL